MKLGRILCVPPCTPWYDLSAAWLHYALMTGNDRWRLQANMEVGRTLQQTRAPVDLSRSVVRIE